MSPLSGIADLQGVINLGRWRVAPEFGAEARYLLLPSALVLESAAGGGPDLALEFITDRNTNDPADSLYAMIEMGLALPDDVAAAFEDLRSIRPGATLQAAALTVEGWWVLEVPPAEGFSRPLSWSSPGHTRLRQRLPETVGLLLYNSLKSGAGTLRSAAQVSVACVPPRLPVTATARTSVLLAALRGLAPGRASVPYARLIDAFLNGPGSATLTLSGAPGAGDAAWMACAMALQVCTRFGRSVPTPSIMEGPHVALPDPHDPALPPTVTFDLRTPLLAREPVLLAGDPFALAAVAAGGKGIDALTTFTRIPSYDAMTKLRVSVAASLPPRIVGVLAVEVTLRVDPALTLHGSPFVRTISLHPPPEDGQETVELAFRNPTKRYTWQVSVVMDDGERLLGEEITANEEWLLVDAASLPGRTLTVEAGQALLAQATVSIRLVDKDGAELAAADCEAASPSATFVSPYDHDAAALEVVARDRTGGAPPLPLRLPPQSMAIELFTFPTYGPTEAHVSAAFSGTSADVALAFEAESGGEPVVLTLTAAEPTATFRYYSSNIFRNRYRWRPADGGAWSGYLDPSIPLTVDA